MINLISTNNDTNMLVTGVGVRRNADQLKLTGADPFPLRNEGVNLLLGTVKEGDGDGEMERWRDMEMAERYEWIGEEMNGSMRSGMDRSRGPEWIGEEMNGSMRSGMDRGRNG